MLSNRESARRSRHRKQAHVQQIEVKAVTMEADNLVMKAALARASEQETRSIEERTRLYSEVAALRARVSRCPGVLPVLFLFSFTELIGQSCGMSHQLCDADSTPMMRILPTLSLSLAASGEEKRC